MGVNAEKFIKLHDGPVTDLQRQFGKYIKDLDKIKQSGIFLASEPAPHESVKPKIEKTPNGYPIAPEINEQLRKDELEELLRIFLSIHYSKFHI